MSAAAKDSLLGRPKKFKDEDTSSLTVKIPVSLRAHINGLGPIATDAVIGILTFERDLVARIEDVRSELIKSAAQHGLEYTQARADTIARLVKQALAAEKKSKK